MEYELSNDELHKKAQIWAALSNRTERERFFPITGISNATKQRLHEIADSLSLGSVSNPINLAEGVTRLRKKGRRRTQKHKKKGKRRTQKHKKKGKRRTQK